MTTTNLHLTLPTVGASTDTWGDENNTVLTGLDSLFNIMGWANLSGYTHAYVGATQFKVTGADLSLTYHVGRRVKAVGTLTGTIYGTISVIAFSTDTTVTVVWDSGSLSNETLTIYLLHVPVTGAATGTGKVVLATSPTLVTPALGTPASGVMTNCTGLPQTGLAGLTNYLSGLVLSTAGSSATFGIASGAASDGTNAAIMALASAYTKTTSAWALGTGNGALDTGSIANSTWYSAWLIQRSDTGVVDVLASTSSTAPTMPTSYDRKRHIGFMKTDGSAHWVKFIQTGDMVLWDVPVGDVSTSALGATATSYTLSVPTGFAVEAIIRGRVSGAVATSGVQFYSPQVSDRVFDSPAGYASQKVINTDNEHNCFADRILTNTSGQIRGVGDGSSLSVVIATLGWVYTRGK